MRKYAYDYVSLAVAHYLTIKGSKQISGQQLLNYTYNIVILLFFCLYCFWGMYWLLGIASYLSTYSVYKTVNKILHQSYPITYVTIYEFILFIYFACIMFCHLLVVYSFRSLLYIHIFIFFLHHTKLSFYVFLCFQIFYFYAVPSILLLLSFSFL